MGQCLAPANQTGGGGSNGSSGKKENNWTHVPNSPLSPTEIISRIRKEDGEFMIGNRVLSYGVICFRGYYPDTPYKANQDEYKVVTPSQWQANRALFSVYDGHGHVGEKCARFAQQLLPKEAMNAERNGAFSSGDGAAVGALTHVFVDVNKKMHAATDIDDTLSGTTAVMGMVLGEDIWVSNVGDSRAIVGLKNGAGGIDVKPLSTDQTPYRRDERARVRKSGARVLNMDQLEGLEAIHDDWDMALGDEVDEAGDPPRIWSQDGAYPGTAFTRSFGDSIAEELGVFAEPETLKHTMGPSDQLMVVASDGIWEFLTNSEVMAIVTAADDPQDAACQLWKAAYKEWITKEVRTDDITVIVVDLNGFYSSGGGGGGGGGVSRGGGTKKDTRRGSLK